ncbi:uncharacterized protein LOC129801418 [Phlebotomus papatasi]|uniref:uncharacterized protein LOC129801418 n=1 Tax=Phlebotomus papatasi TaxID=29031 RepID=UPI0024841C89|nr:uncharacterized protein LOC129801418 [Phlebotomus papatasi]
MHEENNPNVVRDTNPGTKRARKGLNTKKSQRECFGNFAIKNPSVWDSLASGYDASWDELNKMLNDLGPPQKVKDDWIKNFRDWIYQLKHKERSDCKRILSNLEQKSLAAFGNISYEGDSTIKARGIPSISSHSQLTPSASGSFSPACNGFPEDLIEELPDPQTIADEIPRNSDDQGGVGRRRPQKKQTLDVLMIIELNTSQFHVIIKCETRVNNFSSCCRIIV